MTDKTKRRRGDKRTAGSIRAEKKRAAAAKVAEQARQKAVIEKAVRDADKKFAEVQENRRKARLNKQRKPTSRPASSLLNKQRKPTSRPTSRPASRPTSRPTSRPASKTKKPPPKTIQGVGRAFLSTMRQTLREAVRKRKKN